MAQITLNESQFELLKKLMKEGEESLNEISYRTVEKASEKNYDVFTEMSYAFSDFYETIKYNDDTENPYVREIKKYADAIKEILDRKMKQNDNFNDELGKFDYKKFYQDKGRPESEEDYDDLDLKYLQNKYPKD